MNQASLFDPNRTTPQTCTVRGCGAIRFPNQERVPTCRHDLDRQGTRPKGCLNTYNPATAPLPEGY